jgi:site-specific DNA recombinase
MHHSSAGREILGQGEGVWTMKPRCAIYARFSSDKQSAASIHDQVRKCRECAQAHGWEILDGHIYSDEAISGATAERAGLKRLLAAANGKCFDIVLIDDTSRLSRKLSDSINLSDRLMFAGVRIVFVSQGIDSENEQADILLATHGIVDSLYIRELAKKTFRGVEGRVLNKLHHGGRCFGYKSTPIEDPERRDQYGRPLIAGARLQIDEAQARTIRKIFALYAGGVSIKGIAKKMNADHAESPLPRAGRQHSWAPSSIAGILRNERYRGVVNWATTKKIRDPQSGKRIQRDRPKSEWVRVEMPEQRIVPEKLWLAVQERRAYVNRVWGAQGRKGGLMNARAASSPYIFSGLLKCGLCGNNFTLVSGTGAKRKSARYGCPFHATRGTCKNSRLVARDVLKTELLTKLQRDVLSDVAIDYVLDKVGQEIEKRFAALDGEMEGMRRRKKALESELGNLSKAVADGMDLMSIRAAIMEREAELSSITSRMLGRGTGSVHAQVSGLRKLVKEDLRDIRALISGKHGKPAAVRHEFARHIEAITLYPEGKGRAIRYKGAWKLLGDTDGAEGQNRTGYAGLFRAALYR